MGLLVTPASGFASNFEFSTCTISSTENQAAYRQKFHIYVPEQNHDFSCLHKELAGPLRPRPSRSD